MKEGFKRVVLSLKPEVVERLEVVKSEFGVGKSAQIQGLIIKHLESEFPGMGKILEARRSGLKPLFSEKGGSAEA